MSAFLPEKSSHFAFFVTSATETSQAVIDALNQLLFGE